MKKILFIATGGTIACAQTEKGLSPEAAANELLAQLPDLSNVCKVSVVQLFNLDSTNMSPREWTELALCIQRNYSDYDGFVVSHGTDTLAYGAAALCCLIQNSGKPIILTGSQLPMGTENSDAPRNLYDAFLAACSDLCGVAVVFCGRIIDGKCAKKIHTRSFDAFHSMGAEDIGYISDKKVALHKEFDPDTAPVFFNRMDTAVSLIKLIPALDTAILNFVAEHSRVLIIEGFGTGGFPDYGNRSFELKIAELVMNGVIVIMHTQVLEGGCDMSLYEVGRDVCKRYGIIEAKGMTTEMASMKAMWALSYSYGREDFEELFLRNV